MIRETGWTLAVTSMAPEKGDLDRALFYIDMMRHANKMGVDMGDGYTYMFDVIGVICGMMKEESERSLYYMTELRNHLAKDKKPGIEYTDMMTAMLYDRLMSKYRETFGDKLLEVTIDGKKYIALSMNEWNIEKPFMGWKKDTDQESLYYCCDDGSVTDDLHGEWGFNFYYDKDGVKPQEGANARLITVTPKSRSNHYEREIQDAQVRAQSDRWEHDEGTAADHPRHHHLHRAHLRHGALHRTAPGRAGTAANGHDVDSRH